MDLLENVARFRVVVTGDLASVSAGERRLSQDLKSLERQGLVEQRSVAQLRSGRVADVVSATAQGQALLDSHRDLSRDRGQVYYSGWVKPREVWHDAQPFRMVHQVSAEVEREGGTVRRVILDDELKGMAYRLLHEYRRVASLRLTPTRRWRPSVVWSRTRAASCSQTCGSRSRTWTAACARWISSS